MVVLRLNGADKISFPWFLRHLLPCDAAEGAIKDIGAIILVSGSMNFNSFFFCQLPGVPCVFFMAITGHAQY